MGEIDELRSSRRGVPPVPINDVRKGLGNQDSVPASVGRMPIASYEPQIHSSGKSREGSRVHAFQVTNEALETMRIGCRNRGSAVL